MVLRGPYQNYQLGVTGITTGGHRIRVRAAAAGTTYTVADPNVATVSADGVVTSLSPGETTVTVTNGHLTVPVSVKVAFYPVQLYGEGLRGAGRE